MAGVRDMDRREELATLTEHVDRAERLVQRQRDLIARLPAEARGMEIALQLLEKLELTLASLRDYRDLIRREIEDEADSPALGRGHTHAPTDASASAGKGTAEPSSRS
jgi:hypothetical protein